MSEYKRRSDLDYGWAANRKPPPSLAWARPDGSSPNTEKKNGGVGMLTQIIAELMKGVGTPQRLGDVDYTIQNLRGGARLWWDANAKKLYATRPNAHLQPAEAATFGRHIKQLTGVTILSTQPTRIEDGLNIHLGTVWQLKLDSGEDNPASTQGTLFL